VGRNRAEDRLRTGLPAAGHLALAAPGHRHHPPGRRRDLRRLRPARLAGPRPDSQRPDPAVRQVVGDLLLRARHGRASRLPPDDQAGMAQAPWPVTTLVSCLPVLVLAMGTALAHMLRADAEAVDAPDSRTGPRAIRRSPSRSAEDRDGPGRRQPEADRDRSVSRDQTGPKPGPQGGRRIRGPDPRPAQPQAEQARLVARRLAAAGRPISRRALRGAGVTGSNQALNALARRINAEQAGTTPPEPISPD
jgi:hypothetical protein